MKYDIFHVKKGVIPDYRIEAIGTIIANCFDCNVEDIQWIGEDFTVDLFSSEKKHIKSQPNSKLAAAMENKLKSIKKTYLQKQGVICPYCGSGNIGEFDHDYDSVIVCDIECFDCGKQWRDYYELHDVELVDEPPHD